MLCNSPGCWDRITSSDWDWAIVVISVASDIVHRKDKAIKAFVLISSPRNYQQWRLWKTLRFDIKKQSKIEHKGNRKKVAMKAWKISNERWKREGWRLQFPEQHLKLWYHDRNWKKTFFTSYLTMYRGWLYIHRNLSYQNPTIYGILTNQETT